MMKNIKAKLNNIVGSEYFRNMGLSKMKYINIYRDSLVSTTYEESNNAFMFKGKHYQNIIRWKYRIQ